MALDATYDPILSRVRLSGTFLSPSTYAVFDRTVDGIRYEPVRGGTHVPVVSQNANVDDYEFPAGVPVTYRLRGYNASDVLQVTNTDTITQDLASVWLKVPAAPFLNQAVEVVDVSEVTRPARSQIFPIVGRTFPIAVGDVAGSRSFTLRLLTRTVDARNDLDYLFAAGEIVHLHLPLDVDYFPGGYFSVGDVAHASTLRLSVNHVWSVPLVEVAAPGPDVVGSSYTWASVVADYATWSDLIAANATWNDLLNHTGTPSDVIVP
jgi:hypothetical protein